MITKLLNLFRKKKKITCCIDCEYYILLSSASTSFQGFGRCRRYPPSITPVDIHETALSCGEFKQIGN